jgi:hypothetical protein
MAYGNTQLKRSDVAADIVVELPDDKNPSDLTNAHLMSTPVVAQGLTATPPASFRFRQIDAQTNIHELLLQVRKAGQVFWVGVAVPDREDLDFTRAQVWFHPTVVQDGRTLADDKDYPAFKGGWSGEDFVDLKDRRDVKRFIAKLGVQLAFAGLNIPLLIPFTTMAALQKTGTNQNMFTDRPVQTLNAIMAAVQAEIDADSIAGFDQLTAIGAASFSNGIIALREFFLPAMLSSGLVQEVIDFDSPHITGQRKILTRSGDARPTCFSQEPPLRPDVGYVTLTEDHFARITALANLPDKRRMHQRIGNMMYFAAMENSVLQPATSNETVGE